MNQLFFELIRVSIGVQNMLSRIPSEKEWGMLYDFAVKQSLIGVTFAGVRQLADNLSKGLEDLGMSNLQVGTWMCSAASIQQRNFEIDRQCAELQQHLAESGFRSCILKGQGVARLYGDALCDLRQSGDIDIWIDGDKDLALNWVRMQGVRIRSIDVVHAHADIFTDTEVEIHSQPSWMYNFFSDKVLQRYFRKNEFTQFVNIDEKINFSYPTVAFNLVYLLIHINRHIFEEGIGFRQLMDYYFTLKSSTVCERREAMELLCKLGLSRFVRGIMYIEQSVFGLDSSLLLCDADSDEGEFLLQDILRGGNFGRYDSRNVILPVEKRFSRGYYNMIRNVRYLRHYPSEVIAIPFWKLWHYCWRKKKGYL